MVVQHEDYTKCHECQILSYVYFITIFLKDVPAAFKRKRIPSIAYVAPVYPVWHGRTGSSQVGKEEKEESPQMRGKGRQLLPLPGL